MFIYLIVETIVAIAAALLLVLRSKKADGVVYGKLDKAGIITNIVLIPVYVILSLPCMALGLFCSPGYKGFLEILGWIVSVFIPSTPLFCCIGLGLSVVLRRKGKSKQSFAVQFAGLVGGILSIFMFSVFYGNLLGCIN